MLRISKLADYGTVVMTYMAGSPQRVLSAQEIALAVGLELPTVSKILKMLARKKLLLSLRGVKGGYLLARPAEDISIAEIIDALESRPSGLTECSSATGLCRHESVCAVRSNWQRISKMVHEALQDIRLTELSRPPEHILETHIEAGAVRRRTRDLHPVSTER
jgi:FeS assembly SUF system regulator